MKKSGGINIGTSSILVIFVLLALVTFAALSYLSAKSDYKLSKEAADRMACYYDANRTAERHLSDIEKRLTKHNSSVASEADYYKGIERLFADNSLINVEEIEDKIVLTYTIAVTKGQNLDVRLIVHYPTDEDQRLYYIEKWSTSTNQEWLENVQNGNFEDSGVKLLF